MPRPTGVDSLAGGAIYGSRMNHQVFLPLLVVLVASLGAHEARADDLQAIQGRWQIESAEAGGKQITEPDLTEVVITIEGDQYRLMTKDGPDGGTVQLDETKTPKWMDSTDTEGLDIGKVILGIYEVTGDTMRVCYAFGGGERPTQFATEEGSSNLLITYKRVP